ncbi:amino acid ABC transporter permease [Paracoccus laeviglucosivorans]|uniref:Amino acid ABC transporter membrane protein 1, PAAT family n=1 Tax=Paracoccus laeviglucosivorans TaxID=1197861 RepID=A0A521F1A9_9RHOB|nr:amino acid ABC transporter permease [Paracoccus laeviglucosivorans]SMO89856.1 amino acid ABC transporter membrane protein 1, PAAT family [Paracoccus laeviglucosivorans]
MDFLLPADQMALLLGGVRTTVLLFAIAWVIAFALAIALVVIRATDYRPCRWFVDAFVAYHRNVPLLVQVMFWYFGMPELLPETIRFWLYDHNAEFCFAVIALALGSAAYQAEDIRSGLRAIPATQFEAARALGCSYLETMRYIVVPQALRISLPPLVGRALLLFKNTSIAMAIGVAELTYRTREIENLTFKTFQIFGIATVLYLIGTFSLMALGSWIERRTTPGRKEHRNA